MTMAYYTTTYLPSEWIEAHGFRPRRLEVPLRESVVEGESVRGVCPFARQMVAAVRAACAEGPVVLGTHCDQMRRLGEMFAMEEETAASLFVFQMPATWQTRTAFNHYCDELRRLSRFLVAVGGKEPETKLFSGETCPRADERTWGQAPPLRGVKVALLAGDALAVSPSLSERIHEAGGCVVLDATDRGERVWPASFDRELLERDPFEALARAYFDRIADTFRRPNSRLYEWLERRMAEQQVQGLILHRYVWCDLWHAELGRLKQWSRVPVLDLNHDGPWNSSLQTRLEAFLESISSKEIHDHDAEKNYDRRVGRSL